MKRDIEDISADIKTLGFLTACVCRLEDIPADDKVAEAGFFIERQLDRLATELLEVSE